MSLRGRVIAMSCLICISSAALGAATVADSAGVREAENRWSEAFITGDTAALAVLLDADYVSVSTTGHARTKAEILQLASNYAKAHPGDHAKPLSPTSTIRVIGNSAVVQHHGDTDRSVDVFYFRDGRWHAWYSQHSKLEN
ncbi:nuclear transport factor 2 family protein [Lysobacter tyrosinilyticus]